MGTKDKTTDKQSKNSSTAHLAPFQFKKGQSGNPMGRPAGQTLKERARKYLAGLTDEEAEEFFEGMNKKDVWEMAEGKADTKSEMKADVDLTFTWDNGDNDNDTV